MLLICETGANPLTIVQIQTNSFDRTDVDTGQAGIFLHPTLAMVNHSCVPNATVSFSGRKALLRAEIPIKNGDEITISYIGMYTHYSSAFGIPTNTPRLHKAKAIPTAWFGTIPF